MPMINGQKMACEPCIRGHRSTKCSHGAERLMVPVRKPGRPLSSCPHPAGGDQCACTGITAAIPKSQKCGCGNRGSAETIKPEASDVPNSIPPIHHRNYYVSKHPAQRAPSRFDPEALTRMDPSLVNVHLPLPLDEVPISQAAVSAMMHRDYVARLGLEASLMGLPTVGMFNGQFAGSPPSPQAVQPGFTMNGVGNTVISGVGNTVISGIGNMNMNGVGNTNGNLHGSLGSLPGQVPHWEPYGSPSMHPNQWTQTTATGLTMGGISPTPPAAPMSMDMTHECHCGDGCQCVGCQTHPYNDASYAYVRSAVQMQMQNSYHISSSSSSSSASSVAAYGAPALENGNGPVSDPSGLPTTGHNVMDPRIGSMAAASPVVDEPASPTLAQTPSDASDDQVQPQMSVEDYFFVTYHLSASGCDGGEWTCPCGDDCACQGCLRHPKKTTTTA